MVERCNKCWRIVGKIKDHICANTSWNKWKHLSEEHKKKLRSAKIGKKHTEEHNKNIAKSLLKSKNTARFKKWFIPRNKWKKHSQETIEKMRKSQTGKKLSEETKAKISIANKWVKHWPLWKPWWNRWRKYTKEERLKLSLAHWWKEENFDNLEYRRYMKNKNNRMRKEISERLWWHTIWEWELLKKQYNYSCPACGKREPNIILTKDHIIPISKWWCNLIENIQPLCRRCNSVKSCKTIIFNS